MKLYLSSYRIPDLDALVALIGKKPKQTKVALITNAQDYYAERTRAIKVQDVATYFSDVGFQVQTVDLRDLHNGDEVRQSFKGCDLVWAIGGNTFILRYEMQRSGFEAIAHDLFSGVVVYGGDSAGALVAGNDLHGVELADDPRYAEKVVWEGLGLTDHFVLPHVGNAQYGEVMEKVIQMHATDKTMVQLTDQQAYVVDDTKTKVVTAPLA